MSLPRIAAITRRILSQFRHDHRSVALVFIVPIFVMSILGYVFRAQESSIVQVAVVNEDKPPAGQAGIADTLLDELRLNKKLKLTDMARDEAISAVEEGGQKVALVFPENFTVGVLESSSAEIETIVEGSNPGQTSSALAVVAQSVLQSGPVVFKALVPPQAAGLVPDGPPVKLKTTRLYGREDLQMLDFFGPMFIAYIGFFLIFMLTSVSFLRERTQGTMERLSASPVRRIELVLGYMLGFGFFSMLQAAVLVLFTVYVLQLRYSGTLLSIFIVTLALVLGAVNLGILLSAFAKNELQAIQFIPIVILPQVFLSGLLWPVQDMPGWLQGFARLMPLTYAIDALTSIMVRGQSLESTWLELTVLVAFAAVVAVLAALSVRREVA
jgi:ABC-2 type transport system permease protein